jgi:acetyl-CoA carboxylase carboxyl transferase subunit alpha
MTSFSAQVLEFEGPIIEIERQIEAIRARADAASYESEIQSLTSTRDSLLQKTYASLNAWQTVAVARHPQRPQTSDYVRMMCRDFCELHGDRRFGDDAAILTGLARIGASKVLLVGHRKGRTPAERGLYSSGCAHPEGYRKALAKMRFAEKYALPVVTLIDTPGAYPGVGSEQRGVAEAIAVNLREMSRLRTPIICVVIGEGGSGGALGIGVGDRVAMLQHSWYSVISPEGCAAILWRESTEQTRHVAAKALALTASDNLRNGLIDEVLPEPPGGAHRDQQAMADRLSAWINDTLRDLRRFKPETLVRRRYEKFRQIGRFTGGAAGG